MEAVGVLPLRGAFLHGHHVPGAKGEGATDDTDPVLRGQLRERTEDCWRSAGALSG